MLRRVNGFLPLTPWQLSTLVSSLDTTGVVSPRCSTTAVEASGPQVDGSTSPLDEFPAPVYNIIEPQVGDLGFDKYGNSYEVIRIGSGLRFIDKIRVLYPEENRGRWESGLWIQRSDFIASEHQPDAKRRRL